MSSTTMTEIPTTMELPVAQREPDVRAAFISRTYMHLLGAILAFVGIEVWLFTSGLAYTIAQAMLSVSWLLVLGGFIVVSWIASHAAHRARSLGAQYAALGAFIVVEALIFVPLLVIAQLQVPGAIENAALVTMAIFGGLTAVVFLTRKDFSFLRGILGLAGVGALVLIVVGVLFGLELGTWFSVAMVVVAGGAVLYDTSNVLHHFPEDRYVAAALELFASIALMFWYVLRLFMSRD